MKKPKKPIRGVCRVCGCTDHRACNGGCSWADRTHTICTRCRVPTGAESVRASIAAILSKPYRTARTRDPLASLNDGRRNGQGARTRKIRSTLMRIMTILPGGIEYSPFTDRIRAVLEDVL